MGIQKYDDEGRFIRADYGDISVVSVYHPSGSSGEERILQGRVVRRDRLLK